MAGTLGGICASYPGDPNAFAGCKDAACKQRFCATYPGCYECGGISSPISTPTTTTGGVGSTPAPAAIPGASLLRPSCGSCRKTASTGGAAPAAGTVAASAAATKSRGYPWWVYVLAMMTLAGVLEHD